VDRRGEGRRIVEMENISTVQYSRGPTFGDFTLSFRGVEAKQPSSKTTEYKSTDSSLPPLLDAMYFVRVSMRTVKIFLAQH
jgi:hypothetical protein